MFQLLLSYLARSIIYLAGWKPLSNQVIATFKEYPRKVIIFPHTTYWDFPITIIYGFANPTLLNLGVYFVAKPQLFSGLTGYIFRFLHCIPATSREESKKGFVNTTVQSLKNKSTVSIMLAPEGTTKLADWRSGYYYLAQGLNCPILIGGVDYTNRQLVLFEQAYSCDMPLIKLEQELKAQIATIPTLYPQNCIAHYSNMQ